MLAPPLVCHAAMRGDELLDADQEQGLRSPALLREQF